ncbi:hypothetical protein PC9H_009483 [Pleurotus ostreatus]|uniref:G domain-containing protein n=1 Tax=Pleurotus ostreatus TaxID=5322 RepID=A0A8H7DPA3_PLEOS|nr:uncharacterized protein PC9H_009483 [Pleurotus ostreatus]KAF7424180.1 hypothetical protein PC9H_009483 [Pleurotus ostreatus]
MTSTQNVLIAPQGDGSYGSRKDDSDLNTDGRLVTFIDTPGFDDTTKSGADILAMITAFLASTYRQGTTLSGVIYIYRISDFRMGGISTRNFKMFRKLCGEAT